MLVTGNVQPDEYEKLAELVEKLTKTISVKIFYRNIKSKDSYNLLTSEGNYKVEIGDLDNIDFKVKGFKTFVEKYLVYQDPQNTAWFL
jgi:cell division protein FtsQ